MARKQSAGGGGGRSGRGRVREVAAEEVSADVAVPAPRPLGELVGQERAVGILEAAVRSGRVHHAWIFHGPEGVGKFTAALGFGALLLDPGGEGAGRWGELLGAGAHPDLHVVRKELARYSREPEIRTRKLTTIPMEVLREYLVEPASRASVSGGGLAGKVFIVDEAELIDARGQNLLLKTLEEPPAGTVIVLVTSRVERLLATIRSRSQRVSFGALDEGAMRAWLAGRGAEASEGVLEPAGGSPGRALVAMETGLGCWPGEVEAELGAIDAGEARMNAGKRLAELIEEWAKGRVEGRAGASKDAANKAGAGHMLRLISERYRRRLREASGAEEVERCARAIECVREAEVCLSRNVQAVFVMEDLCARLSLLHEDGGGSVSCCRGG